VGRDRAHRPGPARLEPVQDVRGVENRQRRSPVLPRSLALGPQPIQEIGTTAHVHVDSHLVQQEDAGGAQEAEADLHTPPLAVTDARHAPGSVDVEQDLERDLATLRDREAVAGGGLGGVVDHVSGGDITLEGGGPPGGPPGVAAPLGAEEGQIPAAGEGKIVEGRAAENAQTVGVDESFAGHHPHQRRLAGPVGADQQAPGAGGEGEAKVRQSGSRPGIREG